MPKVLRLHEYTGIDGIRLDDIPASEPGPGEVRIEVKAFSLNYGDLDLFENDYVFTMDLPNRFGDECSGIIESVGKGVTAFEVGDRVGTLPWMNAGYGVDGESAVVPEQWVAPSPDNLSPEQACCVWVSFLTGYYALIEIADIRKDDWILVPAGSSSAGQAALQLCQMVGARAIATSRTDENRRFLVDCGFERVITQSEGQVAERLLEITRGEGCRVVYDPIGGSFMEEYADGVAQDAVVFLYGAMARQPTVIPEITFTQKAVVIRPFSVYNHVYDQESRNRGVRFVHDAVLRGVLVPRVEKVFALEDFRAAFEAQAGSTSRSGKLVISTQRKRDTQPG